MRLKQISITIPEGLLEASREYSEELGYRNVQDLILELLRRKVILENVERYRAIEDEMRRGRNVRRLTQREAAKYLKGL